ncbi:MAG: DUF58 domain-containing protein [Polyangia bacterium]
MLTRELLKKIRRIEIVTARQAQNLLAGAYHSVFKGLGMAFSEVRQYQPGDDVRMIDWNVTARMDDAYVKLFVEEREMTVMLLVDASGSEGFGSREQKKREVAAELAAVLAFSAIKNNDRIGLVIFTDRVERFVPAMKGRKHVLAIVSEILTFQPSSKKTDLRAPLELLVRMMRRHAVAFLVSDFVVDGGIASYEKALRIANRRHDVVPVTITDPLEEELPALGLASFEDLETGELITFDTSGPGRARFAALVGKEKREREALFRRLSMDSVAVRTDRPYIGALLAFFRARENRLRR